MSRSAQAATFSLFFNAMQQDNSSDKPRSSRTPLDMRFTDVQPLSRFVTDTGKILPRRITGLTARQQRHITKTIKRARNMLLMK